MEKLNQILHSEKHDMDNDTWEKLVYFAYWVGREEATKYVSDCYKERYYEQKQKADTLRYHKLVNKILGKYPYIYFPDYSADVTNVFGGDKTNL